MHVTRTGAAYDIAYRDPVRASGARAGCRAGCPRVGCRVQSAVPGARVPGASATRVGCRVPGNSRRTEACTSAKPSRHRRIRSR